MAEDLELCTVHELLEEIFRRMDHAVFVGMMERSEDEQHIWRRWKRPLLSH